MEERMARYPKEHKQQAYTDGVLVVIDGLAASMTPENPPSAASGHCRVPTGR